MQKIERREVDAVSVDEINRIMKHLDSQDDKISNIQQLIIEVKASVKDFPACVIKLNEQDKTIALLSQTQETCQAHCKEVQAAKKATSVPWGNVKGAVIGGIITGIIMLAVGLYVGTFLN